MTLQMNDGIIKKVTKRMEDIIKKGKKKNNVLKYAIVKVIFILKGGKKDE